MMTARSAIALLMQKHIITLSIVSMLLLIVLLTTSCSDSTATLPGNQQDLCEMFREQPRWYDYAKASETKWGTSVASQMAFIQSESSFQSLIRPPRSMLLDLIPWSRTSSAYGYAQAQNPVWQEYLADNASPLARRTHMKYATDFIGWYNQRSQRMLDISLDNPKHLYLAYHEGQTGYRRGSYQAKPQVQHIARKVSERARKYSNQLAECEDEFTCRRFWQIGPLCQKKHS